MSNKLLVQKIHTLNKKISELQSQKQNLVSEFINSGGDIKDVVDFDILAAIRHYASVNNTPLIDAYKHCRMIRDNV